MTGAMYAAISGLKAHMNKLNVIGNNIANVNTHGYKSQRYIFHEALYTTSKSGSNGTTRVGGTNPNQIGYGSVTGTIDLDMSTGTYAPGKSSDCMINGDGFFLVGDKDLEFGTTDPNALKSLTLTRVGDIEFKADGYLSDGSGNVIYGFLCTGYNEDGTPKISDQLVPIRYPKMYTQETEYTVDDYKQFLYKTLDTYNLNGTQYEDSNKVLHPENKPDAQKTAIENLKTMEDIEKYFTETLPTLTMYNAKGDPIKDEENLDADGKPTDLKYSLKFPQVHEKGSPIYAQFLDEKNVEMNPDNLDKGNLDPAVSNKLGHLVDGGSYINATGDDLVNDLPWLSVDSITIDGTTGRISAVTKETDEQIVIGYIAIGNVTNPNGVSHQGGAYYKCQDGAGDLTVGLMGGTGKDLGINYVNGSLYNANSNENAGDDVNMPDGMRLADCGTTELITGGLELSKADLATEISEMITTQRGYQANTRIVTVTDSMLEELVNMKR